MNGLSLFANVGIAETYLKDVDIDIVVANELVKKIEPKFYRQSLSFLQYDSRRYIRSPNI